MFKPFEDQYLLENYTTMLKVDMAKRLGRSINGVAIRMNTLNLVTPAALIATSYVRGKYNGANRQELKIEGQAPKTEQCHSITPMPYCTIDNSLLMRAATALANM